MSGPTPSTRTPYTKATLERAILQFDGTYEGGPATWQMPHGVSRAAQFAFLKRDIESPAARIIHQAFTDLGTKGHFVFAEEAPE